MKKATPWLKKRGGYQVVENEESHVEKGGTAARWSKMKKATPWLKKKDGYSVVEKLYPVIQRKYLG